ncbi:hypothetical protein [Streptomyces sp. NPDC048644]|uniref:hypothetical protein n=1 Tax=Streptomyces sp. NPDC048644 TaxID=3365582 RepID=UPI003724732E
MRLTEIAREVLSPFRGMRVIAGSKVLISPIVRFAFNSISKFINEPITPTRKPQKKADTKNEKGEGKGKGKEESGGSQKEGGADKKEEGGDKGKGAVTEGDAKKEKKSTTPPPVAAPSGMDRLERVGILALAAIVALAPLGALARAVRAMLAPYSAHVPYGLSALACLWIIVAATVAPPKDDEATEGDTSGVDLEKSAGERCEGCGTLLENDHGKSMGERHEEGDARAHAAERWLTQLIITSVTDATRAGRRGIHLATILENTPGLTWDVTTLRHHLDRLQLPYRRTLQIRGVGNTYGIHVDDLTTALGMPLYDALSALQDTPLSPLSTTPSEAAEEAPAGGLRGGPVSRLPKGPLGPLLSRLLPPSSARSPETTP